MSTDGAAGLADSHVHTTFSVDARATTATMIERALEVGLREITFTEHLDLDPADDSRDYLRLADYLAEVERCRAVYGDRIAIRAGVEAGDMHRYGDEIRARLDGQPLDFIIGSVHYVDGLFAGGAEYIGTRDAAKGIGDYWAQVLLAAATPGYDVHGHLDVFKRRSVPVWGPFQPSDWQEPIREALRLLIAGGRGIEINTSGVRSAAKEPCPGQEIVRWYRELGGEILTLGSDSHGPEQLGVGLAEGAALARAAGFTRHCTFVARKPVWHSL